MSYKCLECGRIFDRADTWKESRGEFWGFPADETIRGCPFCKGGYAEMVKCKICGKEHVEDDLNGGVCNSCIDKYRKDFNTCYNLSFGETEKVEINSLFASLFEPSDIEQILKDYVRENCKEIDCSSFIDADISWFGEMLAEEVKKDENKKN